MAQAGVRVTEITRNKQFSEKGILTLAIANTGASDLYVVIRGVKILVPAFNEAIKVPLGSYRIESYGYDFDLDFSVEFAEGSGKAVVSVLTLKDCSK